MNPQNPVPPSSNPPVTPQPPLPPQSSIPTQPEVQVVSTGDRPLVTPTNNGGSATSGEVVQVPGGIVFLAWCHLLNGIFGLIGCVLIIPLELFLGATYNWHLSSGSATTGVLILLMAFLLVIVVPLSALDIFIYLGFKRLRKWSLIAYFMLFIISTIMVVYFLFKVKFDIVTVIALAISILIAYYVWTKRYLFLSKKEAVARGISFEAKLPVWGKILIGIFIALPILAVVAVVLIFVLTGAGSFQKSLPIPNSPMASIPPIQKTSSGSGQGISLNKAQDMIRTQDIDAITAALQFHISNGTCEGSTAAVPVGYYCPLQASWFTGNTIPKDPEGTYFGLPTQPTKTFIICAQLQNPTGNSSDLNDTPATGSSAYYYCKKG